MYMQADKQDFVASLGPGRALPICWLLLTIECYHVDTCSVSIRPCAHLVTALPKRTLTQLMGTNAGSCPDHHGCERSQFAWIPSAVMKMPKQLCAANWYLICCQSAVANRSSILKSHPFWHTCQMLLCDASILCIGTCI